MSEPEDMQQVICDIETLEADMRDAQQEIIEIKEKLTRVSDILYKATGEYP